MSTTIAGKKLRAWRRSEGLNQSEASQRLGCSQQSVASYEAGAVPSPGRIREISDKTGGAVPAADWYAAAEPETVS